MTQRPRRIRLLAAGRRQTLAEAGLALLVPAVLLLAAHAILPATPNPAVFWRPALLYIGVVAALLGAFRLRRNEGTWRQRLGHEAGAGAALAFVVAGVLWVLDPVFSALLPPSLLGPAGALRTRIDAMVDGLIQGALLAAFSATLNLLAYVPVRGALLAWAAWDRLRRTRLLWSLTHAVLVVALALALGFAAVVTAIDYHQRAVLGVGIAFGNAGETDAAFGQVLDRLISAGVILLGLSVVAVFAVLPATALLSIVVFRPITRRLEHLARATGALRAGNLAARVPVAGEDEVARLQTNFNAMAADLEKTVGELRDQRDTVARLLQARRELIVAVSHELRTPVATLRGYLESALEHWDGAPPRDQRQDLRRDLQVMAGETERLQGLIEDLFALSRAEVGRLPLDIGPTDIGVLLRRSAAAAARLAWERGRVEVLADVPPALPAARADAGRLEQAVRNLVANAVRHTPPGGLVLLTAEAVDGGIAVQVKDTGEGIAPKDLPHMWERFYRSSTARERDPGDGGGVGTEIGEFSAAGGANGRNGSAHGAPGGAGLGLALVKEFVEAMGGSVGIDSTVGQGSTFTLRLPAA